MLQRNRLSNTSFFWMSVGFTMTLIIAFGPAHGLHADDSVENNNEGAVIIIGITTAVWIVFGLPWFFLEKPRATKLPRGETYLSVGLKSYWHTFKNTRGLTQIWLYIIGYFILTD